jgi:DNA-binding transcriptional LysR family regulator
MERLAPRVRQVLLDLQDAERSTMGAVSEPHGTLTVTAPQMFGRMHVTPVIASLLRQHPALSVRLLLIDRFVQLVEEGIDVAVRIGVLADSALVAVKVGSVGRVVVASPEYLDANGTPLVPADLRRHSIVAFTGVTGSDEWRFGSDERFAVQVRPRLVVNGPMRPSRPQKRGSALPGFSPTRSETRSPQGVCARCSTTPRLRRHP